MRGLKWFLLAILVWCAGPVAAQTTRVVTSCPSPGVTWTALDLGRPLFLDTSGYLCTTVTSSGYKSSISVTRPGNATPYTANDVLGATAAAIEFTNVAPATGGQITVISAKLEIDVAAVPSGMTTFRLYLYSVTPPSALADNAAFDLPSGDRASFVGYVDLGTPVDLGSTLFVQTNSINAQFTAASSSLFGYLVTAGGFTPAGNSEVYKVTLNTVAP